MGNSRKRVKKPKTRLKRLPPSAPAARDEGPRLVPLPEAAGETSRLEHYLALADTALGAVPEPGEENDDQQD